MNHHKSQSITSREKGFTLIEVIIAALIFTGVALIVGLLFASFVRSTSAADKQYREIDSEIRRIMEVLGREIKGADEVIIVGQQTPASITLQGDEEYGRPLRIKKNGEEFCYNYYDAVNQLIRKAPVVAGNCNWNDAQVLTSSKIKIRNFYFIGVGTDFIKTTGPGTPTITQHCRQPFIRLFLQVQGPRNTDINQSALFVPRKYQQSWRSNQCST